MKRFIKDERGNILAFTASAAIVIFGFAALGIDVGYMVTARNQLQAAVDAAALAGASGLTVGSGEATNRAMQFAAQNTCINQPVQLSGGDISFPTSTRIRVQRTQPINLFFARVIGINTANIAAAASAEITKLGGVKGLKPWAVPDFGWGIGTPVVLKSGSVGAPATNPSFFYAVDYPPVNRGKPVRGAKAYEQNIINGSDCYVYIGDVIMVEPGNMVGPTKKGISALIAQDPNAYWDGYAVVNSQYGDSSPRIVKVPLYDPNFPPASGRKTIDVIGLGAFFVIGLQGKDVIGVFLKYTTIGSPGNGNSYLYGVKLVQ